MKKMTAMFAGLTMLASCGEPAFAGGEHFLAHSFQHGHHAKTVATPHSAPGGGWKLSCLANPATFLICGVTIGIVVDKVGRTINGPACATGKPRPSWFGDVIDEPEIWRPACPVQTTGGAYLGK